jgi:phage tail sheath protein FI
VPEYLAPGVYVEEISFRAKSIEGVGTSTTGFVGPTRKGPIGGIPELLTSFGDFERLYGGLDNLGFGLNYLAHAVRAYFDNGGARLYVARVGGAGAVAAVSALVVDGGGAADNARFVARTPGAAGNGTVVARLMAAPVSAATLGNTAQGSLLRADGPTLAVRRGNAWQDAAGAPVALAGLTNTEILTLAVTLTDASNAAIQLDDLGFDSAHPRWVGHVLAVNPLRRIDQLQNLIALEIGANVTGFELLAKLFNVDPDNPVSERSIPLADGSDGAMPGAAAYQTALNELARLEDIAIVAAPGCSAAPATDFATIQQALIGHAEARRAYRIAVLDTPPDLEVSGAREVRGQIDSKYAALYYPWVIVANPLAQPGRDDIPKEITLPPSGFVCGIYARNDVERGVHKAPANEIVRGALRFETDVNFDEQGVLNPIGVNCLRYLTGRGYRVWGARTASSDPEWKYVNIRRYFNYLEASIDRSTQWAVFEPNGERLWANVRQTVADFLYNEWKNGALLGSKPEEAFFVRCDRSTMTQNDLDNGRLICLIGVAAIKPAEFVIFRIGQKTADAKA